MRNQGHTDPYSVSLNKKEVENTAQSIHQKLNIIQTNLNNFGCCQDEDQFVLDKQISRMS